MMYIIYFCITRSRGSDLPYHFRITSCCTDLGMICTVAPLVIGIKIKKYIGNIADSTPIFHGETLLIKECNDLKQ